MDAVALSGEMMPYLTAAVGAYGTAVLAKIEEKAADATVGVGQRLLRGLLSGGNKDDIESAVDDLARDPDDEGRQWVLRARVKETLEADDTLAAQLASLLQQRSSVSAAGKGSVAVGGDVTGIIATGNNTTIKR